MRKVLSGNPTNVKLFYSFFFGLFILFGTIPLLIGITFHSNVIAVGISFISFGIIGVILCVKYFPKLYYIEMDNESLYVHDNGKTITIPFYMIDKLESSWIGASFFFKRQAVIYIHFKQEAELGLKIAFITKSYIIWEYKGDIPEIKELIHKLKMIDIKTRNNK